MATKCGGKNTPMVAASKTKPSSDDPHEIVYFRRHVEDDPAQAAPGREALESFPVGIQAKLTAALVAVASAPPKKFSGGGYWEAMRGDMAGWFAVRVDGPPNRTHYRLFCLLDYEADSVDKPQLVVVAGKKKAFRTVFSPADYQQIRDLGSEYLARNPRSTV